MRIQAATGTQFSVLDQDSPTLNKIKGVRDATARQKGERRQEVRSEGSYKLSGRLSDVSRNIVTHVIFNSGLKVPSYLGSNQLHFQGCYLAKHLHLFQLLASLNLNY